MTSDLCPTTCPISASTFSGTITSGIQDISALLPLLGTEQCEDHVSSALTNGYLYAAASPMSIFGSLGVTRAGFKTLFASINISIRTWHFNGARTLSNMGFQPQGANLSLIMADTEQKGRYVAESRLDKLLEELHLDKARIVGVSHKTKIWNTAMISLTALLSSLGIVPYLYLNTMARSNLSPFARWSFPILRAAGGFLIATTMQVVLQRRITAITENRLSERGIHIPKDNDDAGRTPTGDSRDPEKAVEATPLTPTTDRTTWILLALLFLGDIASIVGYIGCFSVVQSAGRSSGPLSWLCLEAGLSLIRIFIWGLNPKYDDAPPLEFILELDDEPPLPTCNQYNSHVWEDKVLPLTRASRFLNSITSFSGLVKHFDHPNLTLYYTLTQEGPTPKWNESELPRSPHERVLYVTIFDHKERTARVFTQHGRTNRFYSTNVPFVDLEHGLLETEIGEEIDFKNDPIIGDDDIRSLLVEHYQSLLRATTRKAGDRNYQIRNAWTIRVLDVLSVPYTVPDELESPGHEGDDRLERDALYLEQGRIERMRGLLDVKRGRWIEAYMQYVSAETWSLFQGSKTRRPDEVLQDKAEVKTGDMDKESEMVEWVLMEERRCMEILLVGEVEEWEEMVWNKAKEFIGRDDVQEKERVESEWRAKCWQRLHANIRAMDARMEAAKANANVTADFWRDAQEDIMKAWKSVVDRFVHGSGPSQPSLSRRDRLKANLKAVAHELDDRYWNLWSNPKLQQLIPIHQKAMKKRLSRELVDIGFRLGQGLEKCDQFWDDDDLVKCRHSRAKWLIVSLPFYDHVDKAHFDVYSRALEQRDGIIYIDFVDSDPGWIADVVCGIPSLTSIYVMDGDAARQLRDVQRDTPLFVNTYGTNTTAISNFLNDNKSRMEKTPRTYIFFSSGHSPYFDSQDMMLRTGSTIAISFSAPMSGNLMLRLRHRLGAIDIALAMTTELSALELPIPSSDTTHDIILCPNSSGSSGHLSFEPGTRNNLMIEITSSTAYAQYCLSDIQLLDEEGNPYDPGS